MTRPMDGGGGGALFVFAMASFSLVAPSFLGRQRPALNHKSML